MARLLYFNRIEARILAVALNKSRLSDYSPSQRAALPDMARRLAGFIADGSTVPANEKPRQYKSSLKGKVFNDPDRVNKEQIRAEINASIPPRPVVVIPDRSPRPVVPDCAQRETIYATLRGTPTPRS